MSCTNCGKSYEEHTEPERAVCLAQYIEQRKAKDPGGCEADCGHTAAEHEAFDIGVRAGELGIDEGDYPLWWDDDQIEAWQSGHSVGALNRNEERKS